VTESGPEIKSVRLLIKQQIGLMAPVSTGYADLGSNHHIAIYQRPDGKTEFEVVSLFEASRRLAKREPVVTRNREGCRFVMSLAQGDCLEFAKAGWLGKWVVTGIWSDGRAVIANLNDSTGETTTRPSANVLVKTNAKKLALDPIGRIRPAND